MSATTRYDELAKIEWKGEKERRTVRIVTGVVEELALGRHLELGTDLLEADPRRPAGPRAEEALRVDDPCGAFVFSRNAQLAQVRAEATRRVEAELVQGAQVGSRIVKEEEDVLLVRKGVEEGGERVVDGALRQDEGAAERKGGLVVVERKVVLAQVLAHNCVEGTVHFVSMAGLPREAERKRERRTHGRVGYLGAPRPRPSWGRRRTRASSTHTR